MFYFSCPWLKNIPLEVLLTKQRNLFFVNYCNFQVSWVNRDCNLVVHCLNIYAREAEDMTVWLDL